MRCLSPCIMLAAATVMFAAPLARGHGPETALAAGDCTTTASIDADEQAFLTLINNHRARNGGLPPLAHSYTLAKAAQWKSNDMAVNAYFAHDDLTRSWVQRIRDCGYGYNTYLGENIAAGGSGTAQTAFDLWKNSPGHNANMLNPSYTAIGIGRQYLAASPYGWYWTTDFGGVRDGFVWTTDSAPPEKTPVPLATTKPRRPHDAAMCVPEGARGIRCSDKRIYRRR